MKRPLRDKYSTHYAMLDRMRFQTLPMSFNDPADISDLQALQAANLLECNTASCVMQALPSLFE